MASGRNVIGQSIRLEGGEEILRQSRRLGEEGERSAQRLQQAFGRVALGNDFAAQYSRLRTSFADLGQAGTRIATSFIGLTRGLSDVGTAFSYTTGRIALFTAAAVGAAYAATRFFAGALMPLVREGMSLMPVIVDALGRPALIAALITVAAAIAIWFWRRQRLMEQGA